MSREYVRYPYSACVLTRCSNVVIKSWAGGMRKPSKEIGQVSLLHRAIFGIHTTRDRLLDAFSRQ